MAKKAKVIYVVDEPPQHYLVVKITGKPNAWRWRLEGKDGEVFAQSPATFKAKQFAYVAVERLLNAVALGVLIGG